MSHIGESAALYALGALDAAERRAVEEHVAGCKDCTRLLTEAESDVASIAAAQPQHAVPPHLDARVRAAFVRNAPSWRTMGLAAAAAFLIGILPTAFFVQENRAMHDAMVADAQAMSRLSTQPHRMAHFSQMSDGSAATVAYGPDGSWYLVVVRGASRTLHVAWMHDGQKTMLGTAAPHGDVAMLYLPKSHPMRDLALMDGEQVVAEAQLAY